MPQLEFTGVAVITALASGISASDTTITLKDGNGWPTGAVGPFIATLGDDIAGDSLEKILVTGGRSGAVLSGCTRGYEGTAQAWGPNTRIRHTISAQWAAEVSAHIFDTGRHDHTQYLRPADHSAISHDAGMLGPDSVGNSELQDDAVATANIQNLAVTGPKIANNAVDATKLATAITGALVPTGVIVPFGAAVAPSGWLFCDGSLISRATFATLFATIGTSYGVGDGVNTFQLPDLRQRFPLGLAASGTGNALGATGGSIDHVHNLDTATSHAKITISSTDRLYQLRKTVAAWDSTRVQDGAEGPLAQSLTTGTGLGGDTDSDNPPFQVVQYIIKT